MWAFPKFNTALAAVHVRRRCDNFHYKDLKKKIKMPILNSTEYIWILFYGVNKLVQPKGPHNSIFF